MVPGTSWPSTAYSDNYWTPESFTRAMNMLKESMRPFLKQRDRDKMNLLALRDPWLALDPPPMILKTANVGMTTFLHSPRRLHHAHVPMLRGSTSWIRQGGKRPLRGRR